MATHRVFRLIVEGSCECEATGVSIHGEQAAHGSGHHAVRHIRVCKQRQYNNYNIDTVNDEQKSSAL